MRTVTKSRRLSGFLLPESHAMNPTLQLRQALRNARACKQSGEPDSRRSHVHYALYWRAMRRLDRRYP